MLAVGGRRRQENGRWSEEDGEGRMNVWASVWVPAGFLRAPRNLLLAHKMQTGSRFKFRQFPGLSSLLSLSALSAALRSVSVSGPSSHPV